MNITSFASAGEVFTNRECIKGYSFKIDASRGKSALFQVSNNVHFDDSLNLSPISVL